jgi:hypothetical protein
MEWVTRVRSRLGGPFLALLVAAALAVALACCQNVLGITGEVTLSTDACGLQALAGDCRACVATRCCSEATACSKDTGCANEESCALQCGPDYACRARCWGAGPADQPQERAAFETCLASQCNDACGMECGIDVSFTAPDAAQACADCLARSCGATEACTTNYGCQLVAHCVDSCFTPDCRTQCFQQDGGSLFIAQAIQVGLQCLQQCDLGDLWSCVGQVSYPLTVPGAADITLTINDQQTNTPLQGLTVLACPQSTDRNCTHPTDIPKTTDSNGAVTIKLPNVPNAGYGFQGYFEITAPASDGGTPQQYLFFLSYPLSVQHALLGISLYSPAELAALLAIPSYSLEMGRGNLMVEATDCLTLPAPNVTFTASGTDSKTLEVYEQATYLNPQATATDRSGVVMFLNAPAVPITVLAMPASLGGAWSSKVVVFVRDNTLSVVQAIPTQQ